VAEEVKLQSLLAEVLVAVEMELGILQLLQLVQLILVAEAVELVLQLVLLQAVRA
jgi:hypothetical protein